MVNLANENDAAEKARTMKQGGMPTGYVASALDKEGYSPTEIGDAVRQAEIQPVTPPTPEPLKEVRVREPAGELGPAVPEAPAYPKYPTPPPSYERAGKEEVEALIESVIEEKWEEITGGLGDFNMWREKVKTEIIAIKQELLRLEHRFENVQTSVIGKVAGYDKHVKDIGTEIKALEKVLQKIMQPLTTNVKELQKLTQKLKK